MVAGGVKVVVDAVVVAASDVGRAAKAVKHRLVIDGVLFWLPPLKQQKYFRGN